MEIARTGDTWTIIASAIIAGSTPVTGLTPSAAATWSATKDGAPYATGTLAWGASGFTNAWSGALTLPSSPGIVTVTVVVTAVINGLPVRGTLNPVSVKVV